MYSLSYQCTVQRENLIRVIEFQLDVFVPFRTLFCLVNVPTKSAERVAFPTRFDSHFLRILFMLQITYFHEGKICFLNSKKGERKRRIRRFYGPTFGSMKEERVDECFDDLNFIGLVISQLLRV